MVTGEIRGLGAGAAPRRVRGGVVEAVFFALGGALDGFGAAGVELVDADCGG